MARSSRQWAIVVGGALALVAPRVLAAPADCSALEKKARASTKLDALLAVAQCHQRAGKNALARGEYQTAVQRARAAHDAAALRTAERGLRDTEAKLAWLTVKAPSGAGVTDMRIDGEPINQLGVPVAVEPGAHTVTATGAGRADFTKRVEVRAGDLEAVAVPPEKQTGTTEAPTKPEEPAHPAPVERRAAPAKPFAHAQEAKPADTRAEPTEDEPSAHTGLVAEIEQLVEMYRETPPGGTSKQSGHAFVTLARVGYDFTPSLQAFARLGIVDNAAPSRDNAVSVSNPALGGRFAFMPAEPLRVGVEAGVVLPLGSGGGDSPDLGVAIANVRARALNPTLFDPNYLTPWVGVDASATLADVVMRLELAIDPSIRTAGAGIGAEASKTRLRLVAHGGYRLFERFEPFLEARYFRFLSDPAFVASDAAAVDTLFGAIGVAAVLTPMLPMRARLSYLRALDEPLTRDDFDALSLQLGVDF